jgi:hypothetical protein
MRTLLRFASPLALITLAVALCACTQPLTELVVVVDSDIAVPAGIDAIAVFVEGAQGIPTPSRTSLVGDGAPRLPVTLGVRPRESGNTPVRVRAVGFLGGTTRVEAQVRTNFVEGERLLVRLTLVDRCVGVRCGVEQTCSDGRCVEAYVDPATLERFDPARDPRDTDGGAPDMDAGAPDMDASAPDMTVCADADGDGHPAAVCGGDDCDDSRAAVSPDATEICNGGVDDDCDGAADAADGVCVPCAAGFTGVDGACTDVDECAMPGLCGAGAAGCTNVPGSFVCACAAGYAPMMEMGGVCANIDECAAPVNPCDVGTCVDNAGSYACICPTGYRLGSVPQITCVDVDECTEGTDLCSDSPAALCENVPGDYTCTCPAGYEGSGRGVGSCVDVDECALGMDGCDDDPDACVNAPGSFACGCPAGFAGDGLGAGGCVCDDPALESLVFGGTTRVSPAFAPDVTNYTVLLPPGATGTSVSARARCGTRATVTVNGSVLPPGGLTGLGGGVALVPLTVRVVVTTESGATRTYTASLLRSSYFIKASNTGTMDKFAASVALSNDGNTLAVGATDEASIASGVGGIESNEGAPGAGAVYVFRRTGVTWAQEAYVKASNTGAFDRFGAAVALSSDGSVLVVGAPGEDSASAGIGGAEGSNAASGAGAAYVFRRTLGVWAQEAYAKASNPGVDDEFGSAVAVSPDGTTVAVGAPREDSSATGIGGSQTSEAAPDAGAVYILRRGMPTWTQEAYLKASNTGAGDRFGGSLSFGAGLVLAVGAEFEDSSAIGIGGSESSNATADSGAAYLFRRAASTWVQEAYVKASNTGLSDGFGHAVAFSSDGTALAVGAPFEFSAATGVGGDSASDATPYSGAVYVYRRGTMGGWAFEAYVKASNTGRNDYFGTAIGLSSDGGMLLVGANNEFSTATGLGGDESNNAAPGAGAAYFFRRDATVWGQTAYIKASNTEMVDFFGSSVAISGTGGTLAVGATHEDSAARGVGGDETSNAEPDSGAVYLF